MTDPTLFDVMQAISRVIGDLCLVYFGLLLLKD